MFRKYVNHLPVIASNSPLHHGAKQTFSCGYIRLRKYNMRYEREYVIKDTDGDTLYTVTKLGLEVRRGKTARPPHQVKFIPNPRYGHIHPFAFKNFDDRDDVERFMFIIEHMNAEYLAARTTWAMLKSWAKEPLSVILLTVGAIYAIVTLIVLLT